MYLSSNQEPPPGERLPPADVAGDVEQFILLLQTACGNRAIHKALERLLSQPAEQRQALIRTWVSDMVSNKATVEFIHAVSSLADDGVAARAYATIFPGRRDALMARLQPQH